jgi:type VI secretion system protein
MRSDDGKSGGRRAVVPLLARVRAPHAAREVSGPAGERALRQSILQHLQAMCATRLGSMPIRPDYGLPSVSEMVHAFPDAVDAFARALVHTIETYEPRVTNVRVRHVPSEASDLVIRFEVSALLRGTDADTPLRFATSIDASRRVKVE